MLTFLAAFALIFVAEMGDKTQLLVLAFASKYKPGKVLTGIFLAAGLNLLMAIIAGRLLTAAIPLDIIKAVAALSFIGFGLWGLRPERPEKEGRSVSKFGPILTVAIAFFIAEMGDKTQLAAVSLSIEYANAYLVWMGTVLGMVAADGLAIIIGLKLHKHIPERMLKYLAAAIFIIFGLVSLFSLLKH
jgi:Ca2+/H+ antiporter, TMEM165/GDT1 family